jgi:hypothetical protein
MVTSEGESAVTVMHALRQQLLFDGVAVEGIFDWYPWGLSLQNLVQPEVLQKIFSEDPGKRP